MRKAYLLLENGRVFEGKLFGAEHEVTGEVVFSTSMTGYLESLTDPSYYGQMLVQTFPLIGNYGVIPSDFESEKIHMKAYIVREWCQEPSNFRCEGVLDAFLKANDIPGLCGIDTRALTKLLREAGTMNGRIVISDEPPAPDPSLADYRITDAVKNTSCTKTEVLEPEGKPVCNVALIDYGAKKSIADTLVKRGCRVTVYPQDTKAETILASFPDGVMLSNGPGDPQDNTACIAEIRKLFGRIPMFGICLGHQMMALAAGGRTVKLKFGHRGANQPVKDVVTGRVYITSQNHSYAVDIDSLKGAGAAVRYVNVNDGTCEGVDYAGSNAFSMQYHPEAHGGPQDCLEAFDRFIEMMKEAD